MNGRFQIIDLKGQRFGRWMVESYAGSDGRNATWNCVCECGVTKKVRASHLRSGISQSCGCLARSKARVTHTRHGEISNGVRTAEYIAWQSMLSRCRNPNTSRFAQYGGRGIKVCDRWQNFENFLADMGRKPAANYSMDRIDVDGNYEPSNCRWATDTEQNRNRSNTLKVEMDGETLTLVEACGKLKLDYFAVRRRLKKGISFTDAVADLRRP